MLFYTHLMLAFLFGVIGIKIFNITNQILFIVLVLIAGLLPDIDSSNSKIGRYFKHLMPFKHRGIFHSLFILPVISFILYYFGYLGFSLPVIIGYASHLTGDSVTKKGITPFYPLSKIRIRGFIRTGGVLENILFIVLLFISAYYLLNS